MPKAVIAILMDPHAAYQVARLWESLGVPGTTVLGSLGYASLKERMLRDDLPLFPSMRALLGEGEEEVSGLQRMLLSVLPDAFDVDRLLDETERLVGAFDEPHSGFAFVFPVAQVRGLNRPGNSHY